MHSELTLALAIAVVVLVIATALRDWNDPRLW